MLYLLQPRHHFCEITRRKSYVELFSEYMFPGVFAGTGGAGHGEHVRTVCYAAGGAALQGARAN